MFDPYVARPLDGASILDSLAKELGVTSDELWKALICLVKEK